MKKDRVEGVHEEDDPSSSSDSESEQEDGKEKRTREQLEQEEVEALKRDLGEDHRQGKRARRGGNVEEVNDQNGSKKEDPSSQSEKAWNLLKNESEKVKPDAKDKAEDMVLVKKTFRFAGETVNEEKLLPASHPDAIAYLSSQSNSTSNIISTPASTSSSRKPPLPGPIGPRKKKSSLAAMSAAATGKPTKINTLEKSKMDWNKFKNQNASEQDRDEMEAQTKGGSSGLGSMKGYMERKSFLDRVEGRLEGQKKG